MSGGFAGAGTMGNGGQSPWRPKIPAQIAPLVLLLLTVALLQAVSAEPLGYFEFSTITASAATLALAVIGGTVVIVGGGLDLSVGAVVSLVNVVLVAFLGPLDLPPRLYAVLALAVSLVIGFGVGAVNGVLVGYLGLQSIIVTLATMFVVSGLALLILPYPGGTFSYEASMYFAGDVVRGLLPAPLVVIGAGLLAWGWLRRTRLGLALYAVGSDGEAAAMNGIRTASTRFWSFAIGGAFYGAAGLFVTANSGSGDPLIGAAMLLKVFAAIALGGTVIGGGRGGAVGSVAGALVLTILINIFLLLGVRTYFVPVVEGLVLILAVLGYSSASPQARRALGRAVSFLRPAATGAVSRPPPGRFAPEPGGAPAGWHGVLDGLRQAAPAWFLLALAIVATAVITGERFSLTGHLGTLLLFGSFLAILGLGQGAVILSGGLDLSVAWSITFPAILLTTWTNGSNDAVVWALPAALAAGAAIGLLNGLLSVSLGLSPIIATLAVGSIIEGVALIFSGGAPNAVAPPLVAGFVNGRFAGLSLLVWCLPLFVVAAALLLDCSIFGRRLKAVGQNERIARLSGVRTNRIRIIAYILSGTCAALVGVLLAGFNGSAYYDMGRPYLLASIAAVVLGGTSITGGRGTYAGILGGALLFTALGSMLAATSLPEAVRSIIYGFVLFGAVLMLRERSSS